MKPIYWNQSTLRTYQSPAGSAKIPSEPLTNMDLKKTAELLDQAELSESASASPEEKTQKLLDQLSKSFPGIQFTVTSDTDFLNLKKQAASLGQGKHLLISESFLARMGNSEKDYQECRTMLLSSVLLLAENHANGVFLGEKQAVSWNIQEKEADPEKTTLARMLENLKQTQNSRKLKAPSNTSYETASLYRKLAQSGSKALIQNVMGEAYQSMASLRMISCFGDDKERAKALKAIRSLEKLMVRSRQKIRRLDQENLIQLRKRRAQKKQQEAKVRQLQEELKKKRASRKLWDKKIIQEGEAADQEIRRLKSYLAQMEHAQSGSQTAAGADAAAGMSSTEGAAVSADQISLSEPVSF